VLAAIDRAHSRIVASGYGKFYDHALAHCDDLRATAERHTDGDESFYDHRPGVCACGNPWPCPDYQQVIDRLTTWGAL
jgi:hypothetical protein